MKMRRKDREMKEFNQLAETIEKGQVCRIAIHDVYPYIVPMNYGYKIEEEQVTLYFHSAKEGRKITPFKINDSAFVDAFRYVFDSRGLDKVRNRRTSVIKDDFLESVLKRIKKK